MVVFVVTRKPARARLLDRVDGDVPEARVVADVVVDLAHAVEVDDEGQAGVGLEDVEVLGQLQRVGAELDRLPQLEKARDRVLDPLVDERLAAADRDDGAGHWTPASMHSSTESRALFDSYSRIFPQPMQARLQARVGSSMSTSGYSSPLRFWAAT